MAAPRVRSNPDSPRQRVGRALLALHLAELRRHEGPLARGASEEHVHDMRVATRRLRAAARTFDDGGALLGAEPGLVALQHALGAVRDLHIELKWLAEVAPAVGEVPPAGLAALERDVRRRLRPREKALAEAVRAFRRDTAPALARAIGEVEARGRLGGGRGRRELEKRVGKVRKSLRRLTRKLAPADAHRLRLAVKKLRYSAEPLRGAFPALDGLLDACVPMQKVLGELHDADVRRERLAHLARAGRTAAECKAALVLAGAVEAERDRLAGEAARALEHWRKGKVARRLKNPV